MTRILRSSGLAAYTALLFVAQPASTQSTGTIPPLTQKQKDERRKENTNDTIVQGATSMPGMIFEGSKMLTNKVDPAAVKSAIKGADVGSSVISYSLSGARIAVGTATDGWEGFKREGTQAVVENSFDAAGQAAVGMAVKSAVTSGVGLGTASGALGISYAAGSLFGSYLRNSADLGQSLGLRSTIGDEVDNLWFNYTPNGLKELASGTPQIDIDDPAVTERMRATADRNRRQAAFENVQREIAEQRKQMQDAQQLQQAQHTQLRSVPMSGPSSAATQPDATLALQGILDRTRAMQARRTPLITPSNGLIASAAICKLDPKTGCHPGHDEKSHQGGCKKC